MAQACNPSTWEAEAGGISEFEASLVPGGFLSSRKARAIQRNPVSRSSMTKEKNERKEGREK